MHVKKIVLYEEREKPTMIGPHRRNENVCNERVRRRVRGTIPYLLILLKPSNLRAQAA